MSPYITSKVSVVIAVGIAIILLLTPFHAFLTVWGASLVGHYTLLRLWKELLLVPLGFGALWLVWRDHRLRQEAVKSWLLRCMLAFALLQLLLGGVALAHHTVNHRALAEGLIIDVRLVSIFFVAWVAAAHVQALNQHWRKFVLIPAIIVVVFGLLQAVVLPANFLGHFGYGPHTITPYETVDQNAQFVRVQSTLRGANPLGAYLVLVLAAIGTLVTRKWQKSRKQFFSITALGLITVVVLYFSYSRSAYVGAFLALFVLIWVGVKRPCLKRVVLATVVTLCVLVGGSVVLLRHDVGIEDTFFHSSQLSHSPQSSNQDRTSGLERGVRDILHNPLGSGPGTAGPASEQNSQPARIAENFFIQIGQETGWLGLGLFLVINVLLFRGLWARRYEQDHLALTLLASLIGLSFVNVLSHAWADDTLAYVWWGLAGIALAPIIQTKAEQHGKTKATTRPNHPVH
jgi:hypothetical protein